VQPGQITVHAFPLSIVFQYSTDRSVEYHFFTVLTKRKKLRSLHITVYLNYLYILAEKSVTVRRMLDTSKTAYLCVDLRSDVSHEGHNLL